MLHLVAVSIAISRMPQLILCRSCASVRYLALLMLAGKDEIVTGVSTLYLYGFHQICLTVIHLLLSCRLLLECCLLGATVWNDDLLGVGPLAGDVLVHYQVLGSLCSAHKAFLQLC